MRPYKVRIIEALKIVLIVFALGIVGAFTICAVEAYKNLGGW